MTREDLIKYLIEERGMVIKNVGKAPYYMYVFDKIDYGDEENEKVYNIDYSISIWCADFPAKIEIHENIEGQCYFNGHFYDLNDLKTILYLIYDCVDENGYVCKTKKLKL